MIPVLVGSLIISTVLWLCGRKFSPAWETRNMDNLSKRWTLLFALGTVFAVGLSLGAHALGAPVLGAIALSVVAWLIPLVSATDYTTLLIPREISVVAYYLPLPLLAIYAWQESSWGPVINAGIWMGAVALMFLPVMMGRMGMGDLRLFILFGTAIAWWASAYYVVLGLLAACVIQIFVFILAMSTKKIGVRRTVTPLTDEADTMEMTDEVTTKPRHRADPTPVVEPKKRLFVPFGPALLYGATLAAFGASVLPYDQLVEMLLF